jgi:hypothetical protein
MLAKIMTAQPKVVNGINVESRQSRRGASPAIAAAGRPTR